MTQTEVSYTNPYDYQVVQVYDAEDEVLDALAEVQRFSNVSKRLERGQSLGHKYSLTNTETRRFIRYICKEYKCPIPRMRLGSNRRSVPRGMFASAGGGAITLPRWAKKPLIICHEMAHYIVDLHSGRKKGHNALFCAVYIDIVTRFLTGYVATSLEATMNEHKIDIDFDSLRHLLHETHIPLSRGRLPKILRI